MREAYRLQKSLLQSEVENSQIYLEVFIIYTGTSLPEFENIFESMGTALYRLQKIISK